MKTALPVFMALFALALSSCSSTKRPMAQAFSFDYPTAGDELQKEQKPRTKRAPKTRLFVVKTTAYTHLEEDSKPYGMLTASGETLQAEGETRSAAADWSRYPLGTKFRILGQPQVYVVNDYGSALVGTDTIDIYQPCFATMRSWGAPTVGIEILEWGSVERSKEILKGRIHAAPHVRVMLETIKEEGKIGPRGEPQQHLPIT